MKAIKREEGASSVVDEDDVINISSDEDLPSIIPAKKATPVKKAISSNEDMPPTTPTKKEAERPVRISYWKGVRRLTLNCRNVILNDRC